MPSTIVYVERWYAIDVDLDDVVKVMGKLNELTLEEYAIRKSRKENPYYEVAKPLGQDESSGPLWERSRSVFETRESTSTRKARGARQSRKKNGLYANREDNANAAPNN